MIGLISDTHGLLRPEAVEALEGCDLIIHAGDIGSADILRRLNEIAPLIAVRGNVDTGAWARKLPWTAEVKVGSATIYALHDVHTLDPAAAGFQIVVSGHSHRSGGEWRSGVLYINPGSAGPRRFKLPVTLARLNLAKQPWAVTFVDLI